MGTGLPLEEEERGLDAGLPLALLMGGCWWCDRVSCLDQGPRRLLLNHITTPHVLIRSAVAASCSLPGIMKPNFLLCKDEQGQIQPFTQDGVQYVDGSLQVSAQRDEGLSSPWISS